MDNMECLQSLVILISETSMAYHYARDGHDRHRTSKFTWESFRYTLHNLFVIVNVYSGKKTSHQMLQWTFEKDILHFKIQKDMQNINIIFINLPR